VRWIKRHVRVEIDCIPLSTSHSTAATVSDSGALRPNFPTLEVLDKNLFEFADGVVVHLNQLRELANFPANVHTGGRIWDLDGIENGLESFIILILLWHVSDLKRAGIE